MHKEVLTKEQIALLPLVAVFSDDFYLVGGTAIALQIGHRESIDFDLFTAKSFGNIAIKNKVNKYRKIDRVLVNKIGEFTFLIEGVRFTFFSYPFAVEANESFNSIIKMPNILTLSAMKAYALGQRAKWKDYVDLYFVLRDYYSITEIAKEAKKIFGDEFNEKLFRTQLAYFEDIDYSEEINFMKGFEESDQVIKKALTEYSLKL